MKPRSRTYETKQTWGISSKFWANLDENPHPTPPEAADTRPRHMLRTRCFQICRWSVLWDMLPGVRRPKLDQAICEIIPTKHGW